MRTWIVDDVMTREVVPVPPEAGYRELVDLLIGRHISAVPLADRLGFEFDDRPDAVLGRV
ncbi:CBS domain-containing protein [Actinoplanes campanulatus]|uniref:CBS domain-containing protein n=1 Tax=Actinoplanes campanulatus TaxID=113559 RepID=A0A7W5AS90_9ACTN|nr:CBS domain-containing protein [Actinoplanes campanulatus]MBB3101493.1 CBS domain-containing protein [Actinoplanes campanulatus]GGN50589.1 hypothetical protein GCM10010109_89890 [Actinoplanes campanulatus]GID42088.1 hypothetical protein Aca09nite_85940 [Actinoplanes campanulatus]